MGMTQKKMPTVTSAKSSVSIPSFGFAHDTIRIRLLAQTDLDLVEADGDSTRDGW